MLIFYIQPSQPAT